MLVIVTMIVTGFFTVPARLQEARLASMREFSRGYRDNRGARSPQRWLLATLGRALARARAAAEAAEV